MRQKHQLTLPAQIVRDAKLNLDDKLEVTYTNGVILLTPKSVPASSKTFDLMAYAGVGQGIWGESHHDVDAFIRNLRS